MKKQGKTCFNTWLLKCIEYHNNTDVKAMLNEELIQAYDDFGTLLHYAAKWNNVWIARSLLELGAKVDHLGRYNRTPLMLAVANNYVACVQVLLNAKTNIYTINDDGQSVLSEVIEHDSFHRQIFEIILNKIRCEICSIDELAKKWIAANCNMFHAAKFRNVELMKCMLKYGVDIDSKGPREKTALHVAAYLNDLNTVDWLLKNGANVNAIDKNNDSALLISGYFGSKDTMKILLDHGANPNHEDLSGYTVLFAVLDQGRYKTDEDYLECVEYLLQHGAIPQNPKTLYRTMLDSAILYMSHGGVKMFVEQIALFEKLGTPIAKTVMRCERVYYQTMQFEYQKYYELCQKVLEINVFEKLILLDLLRMSERKIKLLARNEIFISTVKKVCLEYKLNELHLYYYSRVMKSIEKAGCIVKLEDDSILVISKLFTGNYNQCYNFARNLVEYLKEYDLRQLALV